MAHKYRNHVFLLIAAIVIGLASIWLLKIYNKENKITVVAEKTLPPLADITFYDVNEKPVKLSDMRGQVLLVNLWATWCPPCVAELPSLDTLAARLKDKGLHVVALSLDRDDLQKVRDFASERHVEYLDIYWDKDRQVPLKWSYGGIPHSYLIGREGSVLRVYEGAYKWDEGDIFKEIESVVTP